MDNPNNINNDLSYAQELCTNLRKTNSNIIKNIEQTKSIYYK